jgi:hypothetical protein
VTPRPAAVAAIKAFHTLAWLSIESCVVYVLYAGLVGRTDRRVGVAAAVVTGETLVFAGNGFRCPLTELAERYGADTGSVTDIYLPNWFAHNIPAIHAPLLVLMTYLHVRNHHRARTARTRGGRKCSMSTMGRVYGGPAVRVPVRRTSGVAEQRSREPAPVAACAGRD